jgi:hypothetical protein
MLAVLLAGLGGGILLTYLWAGTFAHAQKAPQPPVAIGVVTAEEIRLVDKAGKPRAKITPLGEEGISVAIYHRDGRRMTIYRIPPEGLPTMSFMPVPLTP